VLDVQRIDFHRRAAEETLALLDAIGVERIELWGHSDGAVIALRIAIMAPERVSRVIAEATHFYRRKPRSRAFFASMIGDGRALGVELASVLARDHGPRWRDVIERHSRAWQEIAERAVSDTDDFYDGRLGAIAAPVLVIHGARDPRTEPGEIEALESAVRGVRLQADHAEGPAKACPERARPSTGSGRASRRAFALRQSRRARRLPSVS